MACWHSCTETHGPRRLYWECAGWEPLFPMRLYGGGEAVSPFLVVSLEPCTSLWPLVLCVRSTLPLQVASLIGADWGVLAAGLKSSYCIFWDNHALCVFGPIYGMYCIYWFAYIKPSLTLSNEVNSIMRNDICDVFFNLVCKYFIKNFCIYVHQRELSIIFFSCVCLSFKIHIFLLTSCVSVYACACVCVLLHMHTCMHASSFRGHSHWMPWSWSNRELRAGFVWVLGTHSGFLEK